MSTSNQRAEFANRIADYCVTGEMWLGMTDDAKWGYREGIMDAVRLLTTDIGAAQEFCEVMGIKVDLYEQR